MTKDSIMRTRKDSIVRMTKGTTIMARKTNRKIIALTLMLAMLVSTVSVFGVQEKQEITPVNVNFAGSFKSAGYLDTVPMYYADSYFNQSATKDSKEIEHLTTASIIMALAASYANPNNAIKALVQNGFGNTEYRDYDKGNSESIGAVVSDKKLDDGTMLVAVQVRGAYYGYEWGQNFITDLKDSEFSRTKDADGYGIPAGKVCELVDRHIEQNKEGATTFKIWISGYSRGGAVTNLAAKTLSDEYGKDNVYAFCFDAPKAAATGGCKYRNIRNYQNSSDAISSFLPSYMGFSRNGRTTLMIDSSGDAGRMYKILMEMTAQGDKTAVSRDYRPLGDLNWTKFKLNLNLASLGVLIDAIEILKGKPFYEFKDSGKDASVADIMKLFEKRLRYAIPTRKDYVKSGMQDGLVAVGILAEDKKLDLSGLLDLLKEPETLIGLAKNPYLFKAVREIQRCGRPRMTDRQYKSIADTINTVLVDRYKGFNEYQKKTAKIAVNGLIKPLIKYLAVDYNAKYQTLGTLLNVQEKSNGTVNIMRIVQCHYTDVNMAWALCNDSYYADYATGN